MGITPSKMEVTHSRMEISYENILIACSLLAAIPAIGGFVVVGQILKSFGNCTFVP